MKSLAPLRALNLVRDQDCREWATAAHGVIDNIENVVESVLGPTSSYISPSAKIHSSSIIGEHVYIGDNAEVGPHCYIKSYSILFPSVKVGFCVELDRCILFEGTKCAHHACIGRCIIGQESNIAFGFVMATGNIINRPIYYHVDSKQRIVSQRKHHGAAIGAYFRTGVNVSVMPGVTILSNVTIRPSSIVSGYVQAKHHH